MAATSLYHDVFLDIPQNVTSERPIAPMATLAKWQQKYHLVGTPRMVETEELNKRCGKY